MLHQISVENIKCGGCINTIKTALLKNENVQTVDIDKESETISIETKTPSERTTFTQLLSKLGYPEKGQNDFMHKVKSYVSCAIGKVNQ
ncbi:MAG: heavy metal transporter [Flexibacter sp. CG_4_10_14_3_um_filter_32_15]|nr:MAG: heavy metal transporter [Flexibacter sp. CG_4_10_14_3_um_filter_32_15]